MRNDFYGVFDRERLSGKLDRDDFRSPFQIDRDRVLHTPTFRRLQNKTQVFWSGEYDFYRTRLTHSLEVAQIGKSVAVWLLRQPNSLLSEDYFLDADLIEAICLSHDLGHPPFGHSGEKTLNYFMAAYGGFEGNAQTLRLITQRIYSSRKTGMDPTRAFLDGVLKYKTLWCELRSGEKLPENHFIYDFQETYLNWALGGMDFPPEWFPGETRDSCKSIECQIMDWADDTAYSLNDLSDSVRAGFLNVEKIESWAEAHAFDFSTDSPLGEFLQAIRRKRVDSWIGRKIGAYIRSTHLVAEPHFLAGMTNRYKYGLVIDPAIRQECKLFKKMAFDLVFLSPQLKQLEHKGSYILRQLWGLLETRYVKSQRVDGQDLQLLPKEIVHEISQQSDESSRARLVCDYLAGMTDGYAVRTYKRLFSPDFGSINDL